MVHNLRTDCLEAARVELAAALAAVGLAVPAVKVQTAIVGRAVRAYLSAAQEKPAPRSESRTHPHTKAMRAMAVGDVLRAPFRPSSVWSNRMSRIRRLEGNDALRWSVATDGQETVITRLADGGLAPKGKPGDMAKLLAGMFLDDTRGTTRRRLQMTDKVTARKLMNRPHADWRVTATHQGLRVRRIT